MPEEPNIVIPETEYGFRKDLLTRLARVETKLDGLGGTNGQGRIGRLEDDLNSSKSALWDFVNKLSDRVSRQHGHVVAIAIFLSLIMWGLMRLIG